MRIYLSFLFSIIFLPVHAQDNPVIENGKPYNKAFVKPFMQKLQERNQYVLSFRVTNPIHSDTDVPYLVLTKQQTKLAAYYYHQKPDLLTPIVLSPDSLGLIWKAYTSNDLFKIKDEKDLSEFCPEKYDIFDSYTYEFILLSKKHMKQLSYYDPEYYERVCPGMDERQKVINCASYIGYMNL